MTISRLATFALVLILATDSAVADPKLQDSWQVQSLEAGRQRVNDKAIADRVMMIGARNAYFPQGTGIAQVLTIDIHDVGDKDYINQAILQGQDAGTIRLGIYELQGDVPSICYNAGRPTRGRLQQ